MVDQQDLKVLLQRGTDMFLLRMSEVCVGNLKRVFQVTDTFIVIIKFKIVLTDSQ